MNEVYTLNIMSDRHGSGFVCFFDEPFGEQTEFESAGGFSILFDCGISDGGPIAPEEVARGLDAWLLSRGFRRLEKAASR